MKLLIFYIVFSILVNTNIFSQTDTTFTFIKGFEDKNGNTYLVYNTNQTTFNLDVDSTILYYNVYDVLNNKITLIDKGFNNIYYPEDHMQFSNIADIEFLDNEPNKYIYATNSLGIDPDSRISRYDDNENLGLLGFIDDIYISAKNSDDVYVVSSDWIIRSFDGGLTWPGDSSLYLESKSIRFLTFSPFSESVIYGVDASNNLVKSIDTGRTFIQVTTVPKWVGDVKLIFDRDKKHIYATINSYQFDDYNSNINGLLYSSMDNGDPNSWELLTNQPKKITLCVDDSISGNVFMSLGTSIYKSDDFGVNFGKIVELSHYANGLYKKPKKELYVSTANKILKIDESSVSTILKKSVEMSHTLYPLAVGNKWYYDVKRINYTIVYEPTEIYYTKLIEILKDTTLSNNKTYFQIKETRLDIGLTKFYYERIDSFDSKIYRYDYSIQDSEYVLIDLIIEKYESYWTFEEYFGQKTEEEIFLHEIYFANIFPDQLLQKNIKYYKTNDEGTFYGHSFKIAQNIGQIYKSQSYIDLFDEFHDLRAAYVNGEKYGDTTIVGMNDQLSILPTNFSLSQNYPNPFNPTTTIEYSIPNVENINNVSITKLIIYDILGREVATLVNQQQKPGIYQTVFDASNLASGIYYYSLRINNNLLSRKMLLLK